MKKLILVFLIFFIASRIFALDAKDLMDAYQSKDFELAIKLIPDAINQNPKDPQIHLIAGEIYLEMEKYAQAAQMFEKAVSLDRKNITSWVRWGRSLTLSGKYDEAMKILKDAQERDEKNVFVLLEMANVYLLRDNISNEDLTKAELLITRASQLNDKEPASFVALGDFYFKRRVYDLAKLNYEKALELNPNLSEAREKLAISFYWLGNREVDDDLSSQYFKRSLEEWNRITQNDPKNARAFFEQGKILFLSKNYKDAVIALRNYINLRPSSSLARWYLAQSLDEIGAFDTAAYHLEIVAREIDSVRNKALLMRARALYDAADFANKKNGFRSDLYQSSIEAYKVAEKDTSLIVLDYQKIGQSYLLLKDTLNALENWKKAVDLDPNESCRIMDIMGSIYQRLAKYDDAINILKKRVENNNCNGNNDHIAYYFIGNSYLLSKRPPDAIPFLEKSITLDSTFLFARISLADAYVNLNKINDAEILFNSVIDIGKTDTTKYSFALVQAFTKLGQMLIEQKKYNDVVKLGERWASVFPNEAYAYLFQAIGYHNLQNGKLACQNYRKVLRIDPKNTVAQKNIKSLQDSNACGE